MSARDELAKAMPAELGPVGLWSSVTDGLTGYGDRLLDALMPTVDRLCAESAAAELRAMGAWVEGGEPGMEIATRRIWVADHLNRRADALSLPVSAQDGAAGVDGRGGQGQDDTGRLT